ncbi:MAG: transcriptional repressor [Clostridiales bacterium]|nr:transcriptional repressor [Clostridiales bacterium]
MTGGMISLKIRNSQQRKLIAGIMKDNYDHPTADEIYELSRIKEPAISRGTVYRNLNQLVEMGEISKLTMPVGPDHFDCREQNHYHFLCRKCHKVFDTPLEYDDSLNVAPGSMEGFRIEGHRLLLVGLCPQCAGIEKNN